MNKTILANAATNGKPDATTEQAGTRLVLTRTGLAVECRKCGRTLAVDATPARSSSNTRTNR